MKNFLELAKDRYSVRKFDGREIPQEDIDKIIEAGICAPTAVNFQPFKIWVFKSEDARAKLLSCTKMQFIEPAKVIFMIGSKADEAWTREYDNKNYDGVQIHAAHGFFLSRFISPAYNHRQDEYGGGKSKIIIDIMKGIRKAAPDLHITMKINCDDFIPNGLTPEMSMEICKECATAGIDSIEVSGNGTSVPNIHAGVNEAYFKDFALKLANETNVPVILVGGHRSIENMEKVLNEGKIECLSLSRPLVREPDLLQRWKEGDCSPSKCISCNMCYRTPGHECVFKFR